MTRRGDLIIIPGIIILSAVNIAPPSPHRCSSSTVAWFCIKWGFAWRSWALLFGSNRSSCRAWRFCSAWLLAQGFHMLEYAVLSNGLTRTRNTSHVEWLGNSMEPNLRAQQVHKCSGLVGDGDTPSNIVTLMITPKQDPNAYIGAGKEKMISVFVDIESIAWSK